MQKLFGMMLLTLLSVNTLHAQKRGNFEIQFTDTLQYPEGLQATKVTFWPRKLRVRTAEGFHTYKAEEIASVKGTTRRYRVVDVRSHALQKERWIFLLKRTQEATIWLHHQYYSPYIDIWQERWSGTVSISYPLIPAGLQFPFPGKTHYYQKDSGPIKELDPKEVYADVRDRTRWHQNGQARRLAREAIKLKRLGRLQRRIGVSMFAGGLLWMVPDRPISMDEIHPGMITAIVGHSMGVSSLFPDLQSEKRMLEALHAYR